MNQHRFAAAVAALGIVVAAGTPTAAQTPSNVATCRIEAAEGTAAIVRSYFAGLSACLRFSNYDCPPNYPEQELYDNVIRSSACQDAISVDGASFADIYPGLGQPFWAYVQNVSDVEHTGWAHAGNARGLYRKAVDDLDLPETTPSSSFERKCIRSAVTMLIKAVRVGIAEQIACAKAGGNPPWDCPIDATGDSRLATSLDAIDRRIARCRSASGTAGSVSGATADLCNNAVATPAELAACVRRTALCQICTLSTSTLGTAHDCAAVSGDRGCNPDYGSEFGKPAPGAFAVANHADNSVTRFAAGGDYADGDLAASTRAVGAGPVDVAVAERANLWASVNRDGDSVTLIHAHDGTWANGSLEASTIAVGDQPSAAVVHPVSDVLFVANRGDGTVTLLDAWDGSYVHGTLGASTFPTGAGPAALALNSQGTILYVANADDGTVTFLDARSGLPWFGALASSTFFVGNAPSSLAVFWGGAGERLAVANQEDDTIYLMDAATGAPADGTPAASTRTVGDGPTAVAALDDEGPTLFVATSGAPAVSALRESDPWLTNDGLVAAASVPLELAPGDMTLSASNAYRLGAPAELVATSPEEDLVFRIPLLNPYGLVGPGAAERSLIRLPANPLYVAANENVPGHYVVYVRPSTYVDPLLFVDADGEIRWEVEVPPTTHGIAYSNATDTVFLGTSSGVLYLDGTSGAPRFGTEAASTFSCGCSGSPFWPRAVDDTTGTLYVACGGSVAFLSTADGSCQGSIAMPYNFEDLALDPANGILYVAFWYPVGVERRFAVLQHDATTGAWYAGSYEASLAYGAEYIYDYGSSPNVRLALSPDGSTLYVLDTGNDVLNAIDAATFAVQASRPTSELADGAPVWMSTGGVTGDPLMVFRRWTSTAATRPTQPYAYEQPLFDDVLYLDASSLAFVTGDLESSRLILGESDGGFSIPPAAYNHALRSVAKIAYDGVERGFEATQVRNVGPGLVLLDAAAPAFWWSLTTTEAGLPLATGDRPLGIASMPAHTQRLD